jgi:hypothetical protein
MKRIFGLVLIGASVLIPANAQAQRRGVPDAPSARHYAGASSARLAGCRAPAAGRSYVCRSDARPRVVYRYSGRTRRPIVRSRVGRDWGVIRMYPVRHRGRGGMIRQAALRQVLGAATFHRIHERGRRAGLRGPLRGHWREGPRLGAVLTLTMGGQQIAQLHDFDRDGLADEVWFRDIGWR